jgi:hypothetical protein
MSASAGDDRIRELPFLGARRLEVARVLDGGVLPKTGSCQPPGRHPGPIYAPGPQVSGPPPNIPRGHYPPPGSCRVWFLGRPPGHQPPPGPCERLQYEVPPGAYLIRG